MTATAQPHILHTEWSRGWGGQEIRIIAEMRAFRERGYTVSLACPTASRIWEEAGAAELNRHPMEFNKSVNPLTIWRLARLARRIHADLLHTHSSVDSWIGGLAGAGLGLPVVRSRHLSSPVKRKPTNRLIYNRLPACVLTSGRHILEHLERDIGVDRDRLVSVPAGADATRFRPGLDAGPVRAELGLEGVPYVIGMVAVLRSWKGHRVLLEAVAGLPEDFGPFKVVLAGDGPYREVLEARTQELGLQDRVIFAGHRRDVPEVMTALDVLVLPSLKNEATSQVVPQAQLVGKPCIVSSAGGLTEVVDDGLTGLVVPPDDAAALREALVRMRKDPARAEAMARAAREHALVELTFEKQIDRTEAAYQRVLSPSRSR